MRRCLVMVPLALLAIPQLALAAPTSAEPSGEPISLQTIRNLFLIFAAVVLLFIGIKWIFLWRKVAQIGKGPRPVPPPNSPEPVTPVPGEANLPGEPNEPTAPGEPQPPG